ncbi:HNH endonuclease [Myroides odoratimimus]|uniref:HNH endonuclease domain-containing protein n=1 Tax=Myroides odoratimimus TaxID=76832 RepID=UPI002577B298|nr:HNH endonuclease domain-containing protein [Myroides odoratimimus]MDM1402188.1 HNH endonuclease [Myroides odoratimimus]MEC4036578.1 HNH endonuclease domain-containing protein [Myroides odoratimimus]
MSLFFQDNDPSLESQWRALILFGKNSATYKFAFGQALLNLIDKETTSVSLSQIAPLYVESILEHLKTNDKQGNSSSSVFLNACRAFNDNTITYDQLIQLTEKHGFNNVVDAFQNINGGTINNRFYEKDYQGVSKNIVITDHLLKLKESIQFSNLNSEVQARWNLVETAWNLDLNPNLLEVKIDEDLNTLFLENNLMRRKDITSSRASLNGYQKGKCFYSFQDISIVSGNDNLCAVDHFFPHMHKLHLNENGANVNGIWNLVLADKYVNLDKSAKVPEIEYLDRLYKRNEFYILSKHPLGETIVNQTGKTPLARRAFLQKQYNLAVDLSIQKWKPKNELEPLF